MNPTVVRLVEGDSRHYGSFELLAKLGRGGMADVYLAARKEKPVELVVVKRLKPDFVEDAEHRRMFEDEARIAPLFKHPNVVKTVEIGDVDGDKYLAMEFLDGLSLDRCTSAVSLLGERAAFHVIAELLDGLHYAHELRGKDGQLLDVVHRDVSPHNLFITYDGRVTIVDFGIAKSKTRGQQTATGVVRGKLEYMAPEQALCDTVDRRADVFAAAVILWELVLGQRFWGDLSDVQILKRMTFGDMPKLEQHKPDASAGLRELFARALAPTPDKRYPTARAFRADLVKLIDAPFRRTDLGAAIEVAAAGQRDAMRVVVDRHLTAARGTGETPSVPQEPDIRQTAEGLSRDLIDGPRGPAAPLDAEPTSRRAVLEGADTLIAPVIFESEEAVAQTIQTATIQSTPAAPDDGGDVRTDSAIELSNFRAQAAELNADGSRRLGKGRLRLVLGIAAGAAMLVGAAIWLPRLIDARAGQTARDPGAATQEEFVDVSLSIVPADAHVWLDGMQISELPFRAKFKKDTLGHRLRIEADGWAPHSQILVFDRDQSVEITLQRPAEPVTAPELSASGAPSAASSEAASSARPTPPTPPRPLVRPGTNTVAPTPPPKPLVDDRDPWAKGAKQSPSAPKKR